jgi:uncharacterized membrane protein
MLAGLSLFLSAVESLIPRPLPFFRIGLSNFPLILSLEVLPAGPVILLGALKALGQGLVSGTLFSYVSLFSLCGTAASVAVMLGLRRACGNRIGFIGISSAGAFASNAVQIACANSLVFGGAAWSIGPILLAVGLVTGTAVGIFAEAFRGGGFVRRLSEAAHDSVSVGEHAFGGNGMDAAATIRFLLMLALLPTFLFHDNLALKAAQFAVFALLAAAAGARLHPLQTMLTAAVIIGIQLFSPFGTVRARLGPVLITQGALTLGALRALTFIGLLFLSRFGVSRDLSLPGKAGRFLRLTFTYFDRLMAWDAQAETRRGFVKRFETFLLSIFEAPIAATPTRQRSGAPGWTAAGGITLATASWAAFMWAAIGTVH